MADNAIVAGKYRVLSASREPVKAWVKFVTGTSTNQPASYTDIGKVLDQSLTNPVERTAAGDYRIHLNKDCADIVALAYILGGTTGDGVNVEAVDLTTNSNHVDISLNDASGATGAGAVADLASTTVVVELTLFPSSD